MSRLDGEKTEKDENVQHLGNARIILSIKPALFIMPGNLQWVRTRDTVSSSTNTAHFGGQKSKFIPRICEYSAGFTTYIGKYRVVVDRIRPLI